MYIVFRSMVLPEAVIKSFNHAGIRWHAGRKKTTLGIVYFHGATASRLELFPAVEMLAEALGANVFFVCAPEHGLPVEEAKSHKSAWGIHDFFAVLDQQVQNACKDFCEHYVLMGTSQGAAYAHAFAKKHSDQIVAMLLVSPNYKNTTAGSPWVQYVKQKWLDSTVNWPRTSYWCIRLGLMMYRKDIRCHFVDNMDDALSFYRMGWSEILHASLLHIICQNPTWARHLLQSSSQREASSYPWHIPVWIYYCKQDKLVDVQTIKNMAACSNTWQLHEFTGDFLSSNVNKHVLLGDFHTDRYQTCLGVTRMHAFLQQRLPNLLACEVPFNVEKAYQLYDTVSAGRTQDAECAHAVGNIIQTSWERNQLLSTPNGLASVNGIGFFSRFLEAAKRHSRRIWSGDCFFDVTSSTWNSSMGRSS